MAETGTIKDAAKEKMLTGGFLETIGDYEAATAISIYDDSGSFIERIEKANPVLEISGGKLVLDASETFSFNITEAVNIVKISIDGTDTTIPDGAAPFVSFAEVVLDGADIVQFSGPGTYTVTQFDIELV